MTCTIPPETPNGDVDLTFDLTMGGPSGGPAGTVRMVTITPLGDTGTFVRDSNLYAIVAGSTPPSSLVATVPNYEPE